MKKLINRKGKLGAAGLSLVELIISIAILAVVGSHLFCLSIYLTDMLHLVSLVLCYYAAEGQKSEKQEKLFHTQF